MEISRTAEIDQAKTNHIEKMQAVKETDKKEQVIQDDEYKKVQGNVQDTDINEVILDNVKFGYNKNSKDFFVKVVRGDAEYKYPTEDMMKIKAFVLSELEKSVDKNN